MYNYHEDYQEYWDMMLFFPKSKTNNPQPDAIHKQKG